MFGLFGNKPKLVRIDDRVYATRSAATTALITDAKYAAAAGDTVIVCSFKNSLEDVTRALGSATPPVRLNQHHFPHLDETNANIFLCDAEHLASDFALQSWIKQTQHEFIFFFCEHYPHLVDELKIINALEQLSQERRQTICFYGGLDDALFRMYGGDRVAGLIKSMGLSEN